jgi:hypothetical protein
MHYAEVEKAKLIMEFEHAFRAKQDKIITMTEICVMVSCSSPTPRKSGPTPVSLQGESQCGRSR